MARGSEKKAGHGWKKGGWPVCPPLRVLVLWRQAQMLENLGKTAKPASQSLISLKPRLALAAMAALWEWFFMLPARDDWSQINAGWKKGLPYLRATKQAWLAALKKNRRFNNETGQGAGGRGSGRPRRQKS